MNNLDHIRRILKFSKATDNSYKGRQFEVGYQTLHIDGVEIKGQAEPVHWLQKLGFDFSGKSILDIGSNQGGMLFPLATTISSGMGIDLNPNLVNAANKIARHSGYGNLDFYVFDLENDPLSLLNDFAAPACFDIVFFLNLCMKIKNWKEVLGWIHMNSDACLFETIGKPRNQMRQEEEARRLFPTVELIKEQPLSDNTQDTNRLFLCKT